MSFFLICFCLPLSHFCQLTDFDLCWHLIYQHQAIFLLEEPSAMWARCNLDVGIDWEYGGLKPNYAQLFSNSFMILASLWHSKLIS